MIIFFHHASHEAVFPQLFNSIRVRSESVYDRAHKRIVAPPGLAEQDNILPPGFIRNCAGEWILREPTAHDPRLQSTLDVLGQYDIERTECFSFTGRPRLR